MANILGLITVNGKEILEVDSNPASGGGTPAPIGSQAMLDNGGAGQMYLKIGAADTAWDAVATATTSGIQEGDYLQIPIYNTDASGYSVDDVVQQNSQNISVDIVAQPARSAAIEYHIPNPGNAITSADFVLTEGAQTIYGAKTYEDDAVFNANLTVNGTLTYLNSTNTNITDKLITLNKGGAAASAGGSGLEFEENSVITGYLKQAPGRDGFLLKPSNAFELDLSWANLTADREQLLADTDGTFVMRPTGTPGVQYQVGYWNDANNLISSGNMTFNGTTLNVTGNITLSGTLDTGLGAGVVHSNASGVLSVSNVVLTSEVTGVLPIANGGTNSSTALNNDRIMVSNSGAIKEYSALVPNQVYFGAASTGLPAQSANLYWDITNSRLGIGTTTPARSLDVNGSMFLRGSLKYIDAGATNNSWEMFQAQVSTTGNTTTALATVAVPTDSQLLIEARIIARRTGGSAGSAGDGASYIRTARFKNVGGTVSLVNLQTDYTSEDQAAWDGTLAVSGTDAVINIKGATNNNVDWTATYFVQIID